MFNNNLLDLLYSKARTIAQYVFVFLFLFLLELNFVGFNIREKISINSTLDFSWFSDSVERLLHGYLLGRDFTFTYGPLFQLIYAIPSLFFHVPSYLAFILSPLLSFVIIFIFVAIISRYLTRNNGERMVYILFAFIALGLLISSSTDTIKMLAPMVYSLILYDMLQKKLQWMKLLFVGLLPTIFGLYAYNLFFTTLLIAVLLIGYDLYKYRRKFADVTSRLIVILAILLFQIFFSFILTHNLDYIRYSLDAIRNYRYVLDVSWTTDRVNVLFLFPVLLIICSYFTKSSKLYETQTRQALMILIVASLIQLDYAINRSDAGHILWALYPSIITFYSMVFFMKQRMPTIIAIAVMVYILVPFKPLFYNTLSPKNVTTAIHAFYDKPHFFDVYTLPDGYYYSEKEIEGLVTFVEKNKDQVYIYPYDSYILNIAHITFNSYALGMYTYSNSIVERNTVNNFMKDPPKYILLGIDTKGALNLDEIPNFTRNPLLSTWIIRNYTILQKNIKYLLLSYDPKKGHDNLNSLCTIKTLSIRLSSKESAIEKLEDIIKPPLYYLGNIRLPYSPFSTNYIIFDNLSSEKSISSLFNNAKTTKQRSAPQNISELAIIREDPFIRKKDIKTFTKKDYSLSCTQI